MVAGRQALHLFEGEHPSGVVSPTLMPRFSHSCLQEIVRAAQGAGQIGADLDTVASAWLVVKQGIKANDRGHFGDRKLQDFGDILPWPASVT